VLQYVTNNITYTDFRTILVPKIEAEYPKEKFLVRYETRVEYKDSVDMPIGTYVKRTQERIASTLDHSASTTSEA
jgi:hypothetical protein